MRVVRGGISCDLSYVQPCADLRPGHRDAAANDLRELPFAERRERLEAFVERLDDARVDLSPTVPFAGWDMTEFCVSLS